VEFRGIPWSWSWDEVELAPVRVKFRYDSLELELMFNEDGNWNQSEAPFFSSWSWNWSWNEVDSSVLMDLSIEKPTELASSASFLKTWPCSRLHNEYLVICPVK
jgi:hypothetical protein